ncbi:MAG: pyridoxal-phosphate dependent enzyme [Fibrobacteria bacterium]|nr:pyridoxal-phosphate dependent enzyme [Fibrobacteria bacterium]
MLSLFESFPELQKNLPHIPLGDFPTPIQTMDSLAKTIGMDSLYIKYDSLSGTPYGGNKLRKLEFLIGDALHKRSQGIITFGCAGSNHALATAIYAKQNGLKCTSLLFPQPNALMVQKNLLASFHFGAELHYCISEKMMKNILERQIKKHESSFGCTPVIIPPGGSSPLGTVGYVNAGFELKQQVSAGLIPEPDFIYLASGTMGTSAGLQLGVMAAGLKTKVVPIRVTDVKYSSESGMSQLFNETCTLLREYDETFPSLHLPETETGLRHDFFGTEYARYTRESVEAVKLMKETEQIMLERTYTGKALAALIHDANLGLLKDKVVVFLNTYNSRGLDDVPAELDYHNLPGDFHRYFEEDVQELDREQ